MMREIKKALDPIKRRISLLAGRGSLTSIDDGQKRQYIQLNALKGETKDAVERVQQYGFSGVPLAGATVIFLALNGNRDHPVAIAVDNSQYRPNLESGEVALYTCEGATLKLLKDKILEIEVENVIVRATQKVRFETPVLECTGEIKDRCDSSGQTMSAMRNVYNGHTHPEHDNGGPTAAPLQSMEGA